MAGGSTVSSAVPRCAEVLAELHQQSPKHVHASKGLAIDLLCSPEVVAPGVLDDRSFAAGEQQLTKRAPVLCELHAQRPAHDGHSHAIPVAAGGGTVRLPTIFAVIGLRWSTMWRWSSNRWGNRHAWYSASAVRIASPFTSSGNPAAMLDSPPNSSFVLRKTSWEHSRRCGAGSGRDGEGIKASRILLMHLSGDERVPVVEVGGSDSHPRCPTRVQVGRCSDSCDRSPSSSRSQVQSGCIRADGGCRWGLDRPSESVHQQS